MAQDNAPTLVVAAKPTLLGRLLSSTTTRHEDLVAYFLTLESAAQAAILSRFCTSLKLHEELTIQTASRTFCIAISRPKHKLRGSARSREPNDNYHGGSVDGLFKEGESRVGVPNSLQEAAGNGGGGDGQRENLGSGGAGSGGGGGGDDGNGDGDGDDGFGGVDDDLPEKVLEAVAARLGDESWAVREAAVEALSTQSDLPEKVLGAVAARLGDEYWDVRNAAVEALSTQSDLPEKVLEAVAARLGDEDLDVRRAAVKALSTQSDLPGGLQRAPSKMSRSRYDLGNMDVLFGDRSAAMIPKGLRRAASVEGAWNDDGLEEALGGGRGNGMHDDGDGNEDSQVKTGTHDEDSARRSEDGGTVVSSLCQPTGSEPKSIWQRPTLEALDIVARSCFEFFRLSVLGGQ